MGSMNFVNHAEKLRQVDGMVLSVGDKAACGQFGFAVLSHNPPSRREKERLGDPYRHCPLRSRWGALLRLERVVVHGRNRNQFKAAVDAATA
jgi:hypothetical protein